MEDDSFMQIVRERLGKHDFLESGDLEKAGLFFNKWLVDGSTFYVDMRKKPMRFYGYKDQGEGRPDTALDQDYVDNMLQDVKRELVSIGCDLKQHGFDQLPEPKKKEKPEIVTPDIRDYLNEDQKDEVDRQLRLFGQAHATITRNPENKVLEVKILDAKIVQVTEIKKEKKPEQKPLDEGFF